MAKQQRIFRLSGNNRGVACPFKPVVCPRVGDCVSQCQVYLDWLKQGEILVVCAWCGTEMARKPGLGQSGVSHGMCSECEEKPW